MARWQAARLHHGRASHAHFPPSLLTTSPRMAFRGRPRAKFRRLGSSQRPSALQTDALTMLARPEYVPHPGRLPKGEERGGRASGGSRTHTRRLTRAVLGQSSCAGLVLPQYPREESNPTFDVRSVACCPPHPEDTI